MLIDLNVATRKNKGTHYGVRKLVNYLKKHINEELYVLKYDISKYFFNLDHNILKKIIRKKIKDKDALNILDLIIDSTDSDYVNKEIEKIKKKYNDKEVMELPFYKKGKGLAIGNMTSQSLAILYLNDLDHYIKEKLKIEFYIRYMDDGIIISNNKEYLKYCLVKIKDIINKYKLELNKKTRIYSIDEGFEFLGYKYIRKKNKLIIKIKNQTKRRFKRKMKKLYKLYYQNQINYNLIRQVKSSYIGYLKYADSNNLINVILNKNEKRMNILNVKNIKIICGMIITINSFLKNIIFIKNNKYCYRIDFEKKYEKK